MKNEITTPDINDLKASFDLFRKETIAENIKEKLNCFSPEEALQIIQLVKADYLVILQSKADSITTIIKRHSD